MHRQALRRPSSQTRYGLDLRKRDRLFPAAGSKYSCLFISELYPETGLEKNLLLRQKLFFFQDEFKAFMRLDVSDGGWNVAQLLPVSEDVAQAPSGILAQADASEGGHDPGIANLLFAGFEQVGIGGKGITGIPENSLVGIVANIRLAGVIGVILVDAQVDH